MSALTSWMRRLAQTLARWRCAYERDASLHDLDDRTLADLGLHRSEIDSIDAAAHGQDPHATRLRIVTDRRSLRAQAA